MKSTCLVVVLLVTIGLAGPAAAQHTRTINLGDLFKRKPTATTAVAPSAQASPFSIWRPGRDQPELGSCGGGQCSTVHYEAVDVVTGQGLEPGELLLQTRYRVTGEASDSASELVEQAVRCSLRRPALDDMAVEFFANGQPTFAGSTAERYLLVCHSYDGDPAVGARRFGYPLQS